MIPFIHIGPLTIPSYGLMVATGMLVAYFVLRADLARRGISAKDSGDAESLIAWPCLAGIVASKIYWVLESPRDLLADPKGVLLSQYGFTWFGGMLGGAIVFAWIAMRILRKSENRSATFLTFMDMGGTAAAIGYGFGRMGCLLSGDGDYGTPTSLPWGMSFPHGLVPTTDRVHPTPVYEFIVALLTAWLLWKMGSRAVQSRISKNTDAKSASGAAVIAKNAATAYADALRAAAPASATTLNTTPAPFPPGSIFAAYLVLSGVARFLVEFIRLNERVLWGLTNAQLASIASIVFGAILWVRLQTRATRDVAAA